MHLEILFLVSYIRLSLQLLNVLKTLESLF